MKKAAAFLLLYSLVFHISTINAFAGQIPKPEITSEAAVLMDAGTGIILYQKNMDERLYPASITKVMTALLSIEAGGDQLDNRISFSPFAVDLPYDSSSIAMNSGDTLTVQEALYGLMITSANEVANALAENIGTSYDNFIDMMNSKAASLGAKNTHFANPSGLYDPDHYTSAYDMSLFMREAVKNPVFVDAVSKIRYDIPPTETQSEVRSLNASNKLILPGSKYYRDYFIGSKSGYTDEARHTLASYAEKDGHGLITVVLRAEKNKDYEDTIALMDYGFSSYRHTNILEASSIVKSTEVVLDPGNPKTNRSIALYARDSIEGDYPMCVTDRTVNLEYKIPSEVSAPIKAGDLVGSLLIKYQGVTLSEVGLYAAESVDKPQPTVAAPNTEAPLESEHEDARYSGGFSFGFLGNILAGLISSFAPMQLNPFYFMVIVISISMIVMVYLMSMLLHSKNRDRDKELLKYINRSRKK